jgi:hypothetical protein
MLRLEAQRIVAVKGPPKSLWLANGLPEHIERSAVKAGAAAFVTANQTAALISPGGQWLG